MDEGVGPPQACGNSAASPLVPTDLRALPADSGMEGLRRDRTSGRMRPGDQAAADPMSARTFPSNISGPNGFSNTASAPKMVA